MKCPVTGETFTPEPDHPIYKKPPKLHSDNNIPKSRNWSSDIALSLKQWNVLINWCLDNYEALERLKGNANKLAVAAQVGSKGVRPVTGIRLKNRNAHTLAEAWANATAKRSRES